MLKCGICGKKLKNILNAETLPINQLIFHKLLEKIPQTQIDPFNKSVRQPNVLLEELKVNKQVFPECGIPNHDYELKHYCCLQCESLYCLKCI